MPEVEKLPVERLRSQLAPLRSTVTPPVQPAPVLAEVPLRVVPLEDGSYEVLDGFKRLARWLTEGAQAVPVVVEHASSAVDRKLLLLRANAPPRRTTAMDEARVVDSLVREDALTQRTVAHRIGRRHAWVSRRLTLARRLAPTLQDKLDHGEIGPSLAYELCSLPSKQQEQAQHTAEAHRLSAHETSALVAALRVASPQEATSLLADPLRIVRPTTPPPAAVSPLCARLEQKLQRVQQALLDLDAFEIPAEGLSPAERRRLQAQHRAVLDLLAKTAQTQGVNNTPPSQEENHERRVEDTVPSGPAAPVDLGPRGDTLAAAQPRGTPGDRGPVSAGTQHTQDRQGPSAATPDHQRHPPARGSAAATLDHSRLRTDEQARSLPRNHQSQGRGAAPRHPDPAGDP
jgi:ParB-like chromosome segregation protein Spo0J